MGSQVSPKKVDRIQYWNIHEKTKLAIEVERMYTCKACPYRNKGLVEAMKHLETTHGERERWWELLDQE